MTTGHTLVVGAGIVGVAITRQLAANGHVVTCIDSADASTQTSLGSLAWINVSSTSDPDYARLRSKSLRAWHNLANDHPSLPATFPGTLIWGTQNKGHEAHADFLRDLGLEVSLLGQSEFKNSVADFASPPEVALYVKGEGAGNPASLVKWFRDAAISQGAVFQKGHVATMLTEAGRIAGVVLSDGKKLTTDRVIVAAGLGSADLLKPFNVDLSVRASPGVLIQTKLTKRVALPIFASPSLDFWQDASGRFMIASSLAKTAKDAADLAVETAIDEIQRMFPGLPQLEVEQVVRRSRHIPRDGYPLIGAVPGIAGLSVAVTHSGVTLAPLIGEFFGGDTVSSDWSRYDLNRDMIVQQERGAF